MSRETLRLVQLPIPQAAAMAPTGNVPLAAGALAVAAEVHGLSDALRIEAVRPELTDLLGDALLADALAKDEPALLGFSLYLWNTERSLHVMREVKRRSPRTRILVGGPEVSSDNGWLLSQPGFDVAVSGEAEDTLPALVAALSEGREPMGLPGVAVRRPLGFSPFGAEGGASFPLSRYPSPYLAGHLDVDGSRSTYVETVRGCRSRCTFCFYPRSSSVLRALSVEESEALVRALGERGARELVFLDPTFNHRPGLEPLLEALARANPERAMSFFAEVRAEGLTAAHAVAMARAGFTKLEIGLQSVRKETLAKTRRGGSPEKVAAAARLLKDEGIRVVVDLIIGLPGDGFDDVMRGLDFLESNGLGDDAQVFPLAVLPGTALRAEAEADGLVFDPAPPYLVRRTATMGEDEILRAFERAEERFGRELTEPPRPHLVDEPGSAAAPDVLRVDLDADADGARARAIASTPSARHVALWFEGRDLYAAWPRIAAAIDARVGADPHAVLDVVLAPGGSMPVDLLELVRARLSAQPPAYGSRAGGFRGEDGHRRLSVVAREGAGLPPDELAAFAEVAPVFEDVRARDAMARLREADRATALRIVDEVAPGSPAWRALARAAVPDELAFAARDAEAAWVREAMGWSELAE